jgi:hypothetical protein
MSSSFGSRNLSGPPFGAFFFPLPVFLPFVFFLGVFMVDCDG